MWAAITVIATIIGLIVDVITIISFLQTGASSIGVIGIEITREGWANINIIIGIIGGLIFEAISGFGSRGLGGLIVFLPFLLIAAVLLDEIPGVHCVTSSVIVPMTFVVAISFFRSARSKSS